MTIEARVLEALDTDEGTEAFNLPASPRQSQAALQRLKRKGLVEAARCPDGAWVWFRCRCAADYTPDDIPEDIWDQAVCEIDFECGYTLGFAPDSIAHRVAYRERAEEIVDSLVEQERRL